MDAYVDHARIAGRRRAGRQRARRGALIAVPVRVVAIDGPVDALDVDRRRHRRRPRRDVLEDAFRRRLRIGDRVGHAGHVGRHAVGRGEAGEDRALRVVAAHELQEAVVGAARVNRHQPGRDAERVHLARPILEDVGPRLPVGVVLRDHVVDEVGLDADRNQVLHHAGELVGDGQRLDLRARDVGGRGSVQRLGPLPRLVQHLGVQRPHRAGVRLDVRRVHRRRRLRVEARLDQRRRGEHQQLGEVLRLDLGVGHAGQELHLPVHHHAADVARRAREEHAIHAAGAAEPGAVAFPVVLVLGGAHLGQQQAGVAGRRAAPAAARRRAWFRPPTAARTCAGSRSRSRRAAAIGARRPGARRRPRSRTGWGRCRCDRSSSAWRRLRSRRAVPLPASRCARSGAAPGSRVRDRGREWS